MTAAAMQALVFMYWMEAIARRGLITHGGVALTDAGRVAAAELIDAGIRLTHAQASNMARASGTPAEQCDDIATIVMDAQDGTIDATLARMQADDATDPG